MAISPARGGSAGAEAFLSLIRASGTTTRGELIERTGLGGDLAEAHEQLFAGVREVAHQRSTALATRHLQIASATGAALVAIEHILSPEVVDRELGLAAGGAGA